MQEVEATMNSKTKNDMKEDIAMMNNANKNEKDVTMERNQEQSAEKTFASNFGDIADLIPEDEQAETKLSLKEKPLIISKVIEPLEDVMSEIPEEDLGQVEEKYSVELSEAQACGCFDQVLGMTGFVINGGGKIFLRIRVNSRGERSIEYCQKYDDNSYSAKMAISQSDFMWVLASYSDPKKIEKARLEKKVKNILMEISNDYLNKLVFPSEFIPMSYIIQLISRQYNNLRVESDGEVSKLDHPDKLYSHIIAFIKREGYDTLANEHKAYYTLDKNMIDAMAENLGVSTCQLLKKMKEYRFLYLTESSEGYQTCVRMKSDGEFFPKNHTEWHYCVLKLDYLAKKREQRTEK